MGVVLWPGALADLGVSVAIEHALDSADVIRVSVGHDDFLKPLAPRRFHRLFEDGEIFIASISRVDQNALGTGSDEIGVGARAREGAGVLAQRDGYALRPHGKVGHHGSQKQGGRFGHE